MWSNDCNRIEIEEKRRKLSAHVRMQGRACLGHFFSVCPGTAADWQCICLWDPSLLLVLHVEVLRYALHISNDVTMICRPRLVGMKVSD